MRDFQITFAFSPEKSRKPKLRIKTRIGTTTSSLWKNLAAITI
jgi:hypothetical protein